MIIFSNRLTNIKLFLAILLCAVALPSAAKYKMIDWEMPVKRFADLGVPAERIVEMVGEGQFVINSKPVDFITWNARKKREQEYTGQRIVHAATLYHAPIEKIRAMVWKMETQHEFSPLLIQAKTFQTEGNRKIAQYKQLIQVPIIKLESNFVWQLEKLENGDISQVLIGKGDVESSFQYWEFFPLGENKTVVVLSSWQDTQSASLTYKIILEAEPAFGKVFPLLLTYERLRQFKLESGKRYGIRQRKRFNNDDQSFDIKTINGFLSDNKSMNLVELKKLNKYGSLMIMHEGKALSYDGTSMDDLILVSAIMYVPYTKASIKPYFGGFEGLPEFNDITESYTSPEDRGEEWGALEIEVNIGPLTLPVHVYPVMENYGSPDKYVFYASDQSYMYPLVGHVEHIDMPGDDKGTMVELAIGGAIGPEASLVFKMIRFLPFHNVMMAGIYGMLTADNAGPWVATKLGEP